MHITYSCVRCPSLPKNGAFDRPSRSLISVTWHPKLPLPTSIFGPPVPPVSHASQQPSLNLSWPNTQGTAEILGAATAQKDHSVSSKSINSQDGRGAVAPRSSSGRRNPGLYTQSPDKWFHRKCKRFGYDPTVSCEGRTCNSIMLLFGYQGCNNVMIWRTRRILISHQSLF